VSIAEDPAVNAVPGRLPCSARPRAGIQPRCSGLRVTGHRYLPV